MKHTMTEILGAAEDGEGFCLNCGERGEYIETRTVLGLCFSCDHYQVLPAEMFVRVLGMVAEGEEGDEIV